MSSLDAPSYNFFLLGKFLTGGELHELMEVDHSLKAAYLEKLAVARDNVRAPYSLMKWTAEDPAIWDISTKLNLYRLSSLSSPVLLVRQSSTSNF